MAENWQETNFKKTAIFFCSALWVSFSFGRKVQRNIIIFWHILSQVICQAANLCIIGNKIQLIAIWLWLKCNYCGPCRYLPKHQTPRVKTKSKWPVTPRRSLFIQAIRRRWLIPLMLLVKVNLGCLLTVCREWIMNTCINKLQLFRTHSSVSTSGDRHLT